MSVMRLMANNERRTVRLVHHPFEQLTSRQLRGYFWFFLAATIVLTIILGAIGAPLGSVKTSKGGGCDIVSFEIAGSVEGAKAIVDAWNAHDLMDRAKWNTWLDYLYLICYPNALALGIAGLLVRPMSNVWRTLGRSLAWLQWLVLGSDASENIGLLHSMYGTVAAPWPQIARASAIVKFGFLAAGLLYLIATFLWQKCADSRVLMAGFRRVRGSR